LSGLVAGQLVDRSDRRRLMILCDLGRLGCYGVVPLVWWLHGPSLVLLYFATVVGSAIGNIFSVAYVTATPDLVDKHRLTEANGKLQGSQALAFVIGPILAGGVAAKVGSVWAIGIDAATFGVSAVLLMGLRLRREGKAVVPREGAMLGVKFLREQPLLRVVTMVFVALAVLSNGTIAAGVLDVLIFHLRHVMHEGDHVIGVTLGLGAVGAVFGALSSSVLRRRFGFAGCFVAATLVQGVALVSMGGVRNAALLAVAATVWTSGMALRGVVTQTMRQEVTPEALLGRVTAAFWTIAAVLAPLGAALITTAAARWGTTVAFCSVGAGVLAVGCAAAVPLRRAAHDVA
jgi:MFS family permease